MRTPFLFFAVSGLTFGLIFGGCRTRTSPTARIWEESVSNALKPTKGAVSLEALAREFQTLICGHERLAFALETIEGTYRDKRTNRRCRAGCHAQRLRL